MHVQGRGDCIEKGEGRDDAHAHTVGRGVAHVQGRGYFRKAGGATHAHRGGATSGERGEGRGMYRVGETLE